MESGEPFLVNAKDEWPLKAGEVIKRSSLHDRFGGSRQSGISPCRLSPNVLVFTDQASGSPHGYVFDGWVEEGGERLFYYTGEGQQGDQQLIRGNAALLRHREDGRALRLFEGAGGSNVRYVGRFEIDESEPYKRKRAPGTAGGPNRSVYVFRLREVSGEAAGEVFDYVWNQLGTYLSPEGQWVSLVEKRQYQFMHISDAKLDYIRLSTGEAASVSKQELGNVWTAVRASGEEGYEPATSSHGGLLALLPHIEYSGRRLFYVYPESHRLGEIYVRTTNAQNSLSELAVQLCLEPSYLEDVDWYLRDRRQIVFFGPPGTGKTFVAEAYAEWFAGADHIETIQFHPSYAYEDFIEGIRPTLDEATLRYVLADGVLKRLVDRAIAEPEEKFILIIDEINRANLSRVFGELLYLLEYRNESITLPYSKETFELPENVYLIGTMNTADRSIALVDFALRRRFHFIEFPADASILRRWLQRENPVMVHIADYLEFINTRIHENYFAVGFSYFMRTDLDDSSLQRIWRGSILPALQEFYYNDPEKMQLFALASIRKALQSQRDGHDDITGLPSDDPD